MYYETLNQFKQPTTADDNNTNDSGNTDYSISGNTKSSDKNTSTEPHKNTVGVFVLKYNNPNFKTQVPFYEISLLGKKIIDWVADSLKEFDPIYLQQESAATVFELLAPYLNKYDYLALFYCDTPLLTKKIISDAIDYATLKELDICKMPRGIIFKASYLLNQPQTPYAQDFNFYENDFLFADNFVELEKIKNILQESINKRHQLAGVYIIDSKSAHIDYDVVIEKNVTLYPNNVLVNATVVKEGCTLYCNNFVSNSVINNNCTLFGNVVKNANIEESTSLEPFESVLL